MSTREAKVIDFLSRGVSYVLEPELLKQRLLDQVLRVKFGIDPTGSRIHLGRAVPFWKLRQLQDLGHQIVLIMGDFTARIGDASDKDSQRPMLSKQVIQQNLQGYLEQIGRILDMSKTEIRYNSEWLDNLSFEVLSEIADIFSVNEMLDRDNFQQRQQQHIRISLREFLYPLIQGYDSVMVESDLEIGGNDQYFNLMAGRKVQKHFQQPAQQIVTFELLLGMDGRKMSTSWGNGIYITDSPQEMFIKVMKIQDELIESYFRLATDLEQSQIQSQLEALSQGQNPKQVKLSLARCIVSRYYTQEEADKAALYFNQLFSQQLIPQDIPVVKLDKAQDKRLFAIVAKLFKLSNSQAKRAIQEGGIKVDQVIRQDVFWDLANCTEPEMVIQKGKNQVIKVIFN